jgi:hypothetical protein
MVKYPTALGVNAPSWRRASTSASIVLSPSTPATDAASPITSPSLASYSIQGEDVHQTVYAAGGILRSLTRTIFNRTLFTSAYQPGDILWLPKHENLTSQGLKGLPDLGLVYGHYIVVIAVDDATDSIMFFTLSSALPTCYQLCKRACCIQDCGHMHLFTVSREFFAWDKHTEDEVTGAVSFKHVHSYFRVGEPHVLHVDCFRGSHDFKDWDEYLKLDRKSLEVVQKGVVVFKEEDSRRKLGVGEYEKVWRFWESW